MSDHPQPADEPYPPAYLEALAYHEAGHAVMAVLLGVPVERVVIGSRCDSPDDNGRVHLRPTDGDVPAFVAVLMGVASEPAERMAPAFSEALTLHKRHRHLTPFRRGVQNDLAESFAVASVVYALLGHAERTARRLFKADYRDLAAAIIGHKGGAVRRVARRLNRDCEVRGDEVVALVRRAGPSRRTEEGRRLAAALRCLARKGPDLRGAKRHLTEHTRGCLSGENADVD